MNKDNSILSVKNLNFSYNHKKVLDNVSFDVGKEDFISILGPNGAGKSTLVNLISGVIKGYGGIIKVNGRNIKESDPKDIAKMIAVVPQYTNPAFSFTVAEIVMMGRNPYISRFGAERKEDFNEVRKVMEKTRILSFADRRFSELSAGEKQRVIIAQALAQDSSILLLDEPTSHLDINFQIEFINLFLNLNKKDKKTIIGIFHDINLAIQNSKKIMLLKEGRVYNFGRCEEVISRQSLKSIFNSDVFVGKNPITKKMYVSPVFNPTGQRAAAGKKVKKHLRIHVIGGGGAASPVINLLQESGYDLSCGVINTLDTDLDTAQMLEIPYVTEAPFSPISIGSQNKNLQFVKSSDVVILPELEFGYGNFLNLVSVKEALSLGKKVIVIDKKSIVKRDHTGGKATKLYRKIIQDGAIVVKSVDQILSHL